MQHRTSRVLSSLLFGARYLFVAVAAVALTALVLPPTLGSSETPRATAATWSTTPRPSVTASDPDLRVALLRHRCSVGDPDAGDDSPSAVVVVGGQIRHVSFDQAWSIYSGKERGEFIALCRSEP